MTAPLPSTPVYAVKPPTGVLPFAVGFLSFILIPYVNLIIAGIVMAAVFPSQDRRGGIAARNARAAANWGLTMVLIMAIVFGLFITALATHTGTEGFFPVGIAPIIWGLLCIANLVVIIVGMVGASAGRVVRIPAIPFLKARESDPASAAG